MCEIKLSQQPLAAAGCWFVSNLLHISHTIWLQFLLNKGNNRFQEFLENKTVLVLHKKQKNKS